MPSECDSLIDEEILEHIYRINKPAPAETFQTQKQFEIEEECLEQNFWLPKDGCVQIEVVEILIPRKAGRPPPLPTEREIDESYCIGGYLD